MTPVEGQIISQSSTSPIFPSRQQAQDVHLSVCHRMSKMREVMSVSVALALLFTIGCGGGSSSSSSGGSSNNPGSSQGISGVWEFVATSTLGSTTLIEADISANGSQSSASGPNEVQTATYSNGLWYVNGACSSASPGQNSVSGTVTGNSISVTFNEGGNIFTGQGTVSGTTISGSYSGTSPDCSSSGTFTGTQVPNLSGTFSGTLGFPSGSDQVTATLTESSSYSLTVQTTLSGADNGNFVFSGSAVANVMFVSGSVNGKAFSLFGYFDRSGQFTGTPNSIAVFDYNTLAYVGLLTVSAPPQTNITGAWEFVAVPEGGGSFNVVEANVSQSGSTFFGAGGPLLLYIIPSMQQWDAPIGICQPHEFDSINLSGTVNGVQVSFAVLDGVNGQVFVTTTGQATVNGTTVSGAYNSSGGCGYAASSGTLTGNIVDLTGSYNLLLGTTLVPSGTATISQQGTYPANQTTTVSTSEQGVWTGNSQGGLFAVQDGNTGPTYVGVHVAPAIVDSSGGVFDHGDIIVYNYVSPDASGFVFFGILRR